LTINRQGRSPLRAREKKNSKNKKKTISESISTKPYWTLGHYSSEGLNQSKTSCPLILLQISNDERSTHANTGARLRAEIKLLPSNLYISHDGVCTVDNIAEPADSSDPTVGTKIVEFGQEKS
jgi:hypothetical protein